jgi:hypothetical protein
VRTRLRFQYSQRLRPSQQTDTTIPETIRDCLQTTRSTFYVRVCIQGRARHLPIRGAGRQLESQSIAPNGGPRQPGMVLCRRCCDARHRPSAVATPSRNVTVIRLAVACSPAQPISAINRLSPGGPSRRARGMRSPERRAKPVVSYGPSLAI